MEILPKATSYLCFNESIQGHTLRRVLYLNIQSGYLSLPQSVGTIILPTDVVKYNKECSPADKLFQPGRP